MKTEWDADGVCCVVAADEAFALAAVTGAAVASVAWATPLD